MKKILTVFGTRPEAIKMAPILKELDNFENIHSKLCITGQHKEMLNQVLKIFDIKANYDLDIMRKGQSLAGTTSRILKNMKNVFDDFNPDIVLVHGDTTTTLSASLAAFYEGIPIGHIEAGLRTGDIYSPWPEEANRVLTSKITNLHFAPTAAAKENLLNEEIPDNKIFVTGNTVIDALKIGLNQIDNNRKIKNDLDHLFSYLDFNNDVILVTGHRRENFGAGFQNICEALKKIALENRSLQIVYPVHLNPNVKNKVESILSDINNIFLIEPLEYIPFIYLMSRSKLILTDSGGIQEEAPSLGKPVLVLRDHTERPEAIKAGTVMLAGTKKQHIINLTNRLLNDTELYNSMSIAHNPFGDGSSSKKICQILNKIDKYDEI
tara:strand:- start:4187 stop:5326 length:1140 start_codon:yes stop_codon:yes gene_type:complete